MQLSRRQTLSSLASLLAVPTLSGAAVAARWGLRSFGSSGGSGSDAEFLAAVSRGDLARVSALLASEPDLGRVQDQDARSAFVLAFLGGHAEVAAAIRSASLANPEHLDVVEAIFAEEWGRFDALVKADERLLERAHPVGGTPLYAAALCGTDGGWRVRGAGCDPDLAPSGGSGLTPARGALESPRPEWARIGLTDLCSNGSDVNAPQRGGSSVLHAAVARRDQVLVRLAVRKGADVGAQDAEGRTPRDLAAELEWGAGVRLLDEHERLPRDDRSSRAALDANREPVRIPDLSDVPQELQSETTGNSHFNLARVRELVSADGRLVFARSTDDELPIEACAHVGNREIIRFHLDQGAPLSLPTAVSLGDLASVAFWLERRPSLVHERGAHDFPVMWFAALGGGGVEMAELLAHYGVDPDQESMGSTALHVCARRGLVDLAAWLLEAGADPQAVGYRSGREGQTPLALARTGGHQKVVGLLEQSGAKR